MAIARETVRLGLAARGAAKIKVRQPLHEAVVVAAGREREAIERLGDVVREELNVKALRFVDEADELGSYTLKPNYRTLGPRFGKAMPQVAEAVAALDPDARRGVAARGRAGRRLHRRPRPHARPRRPAARARAAAGLPARARGLARRRAGALDRRRPAPRGPGARDRPRRPARAPRRRPGHLRPHRPRARRRRDAARGGARARGVPQPARCSPSSVAYAGRRPRRDRRASRAASCASRSPRG